MDFPMAPELWDHLFKCAFCSWSPNQVLIKLPMCEESSFRNAESGMIYRTLMLCTSTRIVNWLRIAQAASVRRELLLINCCLS